MVRTSIGAAVTALATGLLLGVPHAAAQAGGAGLYSPAQAQRGAALYGEHCAPCHGTNLAGTDFGPGVTAPDLQARWKGRTVGDLFALMRSTMPFNSPGGLSAQQNADILAFLLQHASIPPGAADLPADQAALSTIPFPSSK